jgi:hypothetical protein
LKLLFTNNTLATRAGSELWLRDVSIAATARGIDVAAYSPRLGDVAGELRRAGITVVDDLDALPWRPDLLHGHHHLETMTALLRFEELPGVFVCHGAVPFEEEPPLHPRLRRYVAVDAPCRERILAAGVPAAQVSTVPNFVDLARFAPRPPLPVRPRRALVLSHNLGEANGLAEVREACREAGIELESLGTASGRVTDRPEEALRRADVVFAKARAALEALATGCAVVLCDAQGIGPVVTEEAFADLRQLNFGFRALTAPVGRRIVAERLQAYSPDSSARVSLRVRAEAGLDAALDALEDVWRAALADPAPPDPDAERRAGARYVRSLSVRVKDHEAVRAERDRLGEELRKAEVVLSNEGRRL